MVILPSQARIVGGRLAQPWPRSAAYINSRAVPWYNLRQGDYDWDGKPWPLVGGDDATPLFCFGFGLSFSQFAFGPLSLSSPLVNVSDGKRMTTVDVSTVVTDTTHFKPGGAAVVQLYFSPLSASRTNTVRYKRMLAGFEKVAVPSGGSAKVTIALRVDDLGYTRWDPIANTHDWVVDSGVYLLLVCRSSCDSACVNTTLTISE